MLLKEGRLPMWCGRNDWFATHYVLEGQARYWTAFKDASVVRRFGRWASDAFPLLLMGRPGVFSWNGSIYVAR